MKNEIEQIIVNHIDMKISLGEATTQILRLFAVSGQSEQLVCDNHRPDLEHFMKYSESICKNCKQKV